jgi:hypothetical protein
MDLSGAKRAVEEAKKALSGKLTVPVLEKATNHLQEAHQLLNPEHQRVAGVFNQKDGQSPAADSTYSL